MPVKVVSTVKTVSAEVSTQFPSVSIKYMGKNVPRATVEKLKIVANYGSEEFTLEEAGQEIDALKDTLRFEKQWTDHLREMHNQDAETISELRDKLDAANKSIRQLQALVDGIIPALK